MASARNAIRALFVLAAVCAAYATNMPGRATKTDGAESPAAAPAEGPAGSGGTTFDITKLGATGDGKTDSTEVYINIMPF
jgi:galacturan 1,4-alpha-galacturonidase